MVCMLYSYYMLIEVKVGQQDIRCSSFIFFGYVKGQYMLFCLTFIVVLHSRAVNSELLHDEHCVSVSHFVVHLCACS